jgi:hypothetical protein
VIGSAGGAVEGAEGPGGVGAAGEAIGGVFGEEAA